MSDRALATGNDERRVPEGRSHGSISGRPNAAGTSGWARRGGCGIRRIPDSELGVDAQRSQATDPRWSQPRSERGAVREPKHLGRT